MLCIKVNYKVQKRTLLHQYGEPKSISSLAHNALPNTGLGPTKNHILYSSPIFNNQLKRLSGKLWGFEIMLGIISCGQSCLSTPFAVRHIQPFWTIRPLLCNLTCDGLNQKQ